MNCNLGLRLLLFALVGATAAGCGGDDARTGVGFVNQAVSLHNNCPFGSCMISDPIVVNLYWETTLAGWDANIDDWNLNNPNSPISSTVANVDRLTRSLVNSGYFDKLGQYGMQSIGMFTSIPSGDCGHLIGSIEIAKSKMDELSACIYQKYGFDTDRTLLNVLIPPQIQPQGNNSPWCPPGGGVLAEHDKYGDGISTGPYAMTFIPTFCNQGMGDLSLAMTHELVEAITDPVPASTTGWKTEGIGASENADLCQNNPVAFLDWQLGTQVTRYWSNDDDSCAAGATGAIPDIDTITACGSGSRMSITITGTHFGLEPWDLTTELPGASDNGRSTTLYLSSTQQVAGGGQWSAGNVGINPDFVKLGVVEWHPNTIVIHGFDNGYGLSYGGTTFTVNPGDTLQLTVANMDTGRWDNASVTVPATAGIDGLAVYATDQFGYPPTAGSSTESPPPCSAPSSMPATAASRTSR